MNARVERISSKSGDRDADYFRPECACGWKGDMYPNRTIEGRRLAEKRASEHRCGASMGGAA